MLGQTSLFKQSVVDDEILLKHVNAVALMPVAGSRKLTAFTRKLFNVLLHRSQEEGERDEYEARLHDVKDLADYNSKDTKPLKQALKDLMSTTVEWQSPSSGEIESWDACNLLSGAGYTKDKKTGAVTVRWRFDSKIRTQLLSPDRYARLSLEALTQLNTHSAMALYEICTRYVDNPSHKTARKSWTWWRPVLTGSAISKAEYRYFKRDNITPAIAEINALTNIEVRGPIEFKGQDNKTIIDIQFEVYLKARGQAVVSKAPLYGVAVEDMPTIGRAIAAGVKQVDAESLIEAHGPEKFKLGVKELEKRLQMPSEIVGAVLKPGSWLKTNLARNPPKPLVDKSEINRNTLPIATPEETRKRRALWTDEWLRRRKIGLRDEFSQYVTLQQTELLAEFRTELMDREQTHVVKRLDSSGWQHRMVIDTFTKFLGVHRLGSEWDKPGAEDLITIAVEMAVTQA